MRKSVFHGYEILDQGSVVDVKDRAGTLVYTLYKRRKADGYGYTGWDIRVWGRVRYELLFYINPWVAKKIPTKAEALMTLRAWIVRHRNAWETAAYNGAENIGADVLRSLLSL